MQNITLHNCWTNATIDTYHTFDSDSHESWLIEDYNEVNGTDLNYDNFDWTCDHAKMVELLAKLSINTIVDLLPDNKIIKSIEYKDNSSPREYNFSTDSYNMIIDYDRVNLIDYIVNNSEAFNQKVKDSTTAYDGYRPYYDYNEMVSDDRAMLAFYIDSLLGGSDGESDGYMTNMYEGISDINYETITMNLLK